MVATISRVNVDGVPDTPIRAVGFSVFTASASVRNEGVVVGVVEFMLGEVGPALHDEALRIHEPAALSRLGLAQALRLRGRDVEIGDAGPGFAGAEEEQPLFGKFAVGLAQRTEHARERHCRGALNIVVEARQMAPVVPQQPERVRVAEILPLQERLWKDGPDRGHKFIDEFIVERTAHPRLLEADVEFAPAQLRVIGADIERDGEGVAGMDAGARGVEREFAHRDAHAQGAEIAEPEDAFAIRGDDQPHAFLRPEAEDLRDPSALAQADEEPARPAIDGAVFQTRLPDRRRVDDRHHLLDVLGHEPVEEDFVAILKIREVNVFLDRVLLAAHRAERTVDLFLEGENPRRQQPAEPEHVALPIGKGSAFVAQRIGEQLRPMRLTRLTPCGQPIRSGRSLHAPV